MCTYLDVWAEFLFYLILWANPDFYISPHLVGRKKNDVNVKIPWNRNTQRAGKLDSLGTKFNKLSEKNR